jgi:hypothetical protein
MSGASPEYASNRTSLPASIGRHLNEFLCVTGRPLADLDFRVVNLRNSLGIA